MSGLAEPWQRTDESSPFSQVTVDDGNQLTIIPVVDWPCRGGVLSIDLTLFHNADNTPDQMPPPPLPEHPPLGHGWSHSYLTNLVEDTATGDVLVTEAYCYDALNQMTSEVRTGSDPYNLSFEYDPAGNRTKMVKDGVTTNYTYDDANRLEAKTGTTYGWDANGNQTSKTENSQTTNFAYDYDDQLISISGATNVDFTYDGLGRRASRTTGGITTDFFYDDQRMTTEKQAGSMTAHYLYGESLLSRDDGTDYEYYLVDGLGSTRQLTDANESVTADYLFEGFGQLISQSGAAVNPYQFAGSWRYRNDGDSGLLHVGARYYDPEVGRFITADVVLGDIWNPKSLNRYFYVTNNPVNNIDPTGQTVQAAITAPEALGIAILIAIGVYSWAASRTKSKAKTLQSNIDRKNKEIEESLKDVNPVLMGNWIGSTNNPIVLPGTNITKDLRRIVRGPLRGPLPKQKGPLPKQK